MENNLFYGPNQVLQKVEENGFVTITMKRAETNSEYKLTLPTKVFEAVATTEAKDWNYVQEVKFKNVVADIIKVLTEHGTTGGEFKPLLQAITYAYYGVLDRAINYQFMGNDESYVPGGDVYFDFDLNRAHQITKHLDVKPESTGESTAS